MIIHSLLIHLLLGVAATTAFAPQDNSSTKSGHAYTTPSRAEDICPLLAGQPVPSVTVRAIDGSDIRLSELIAGKPTVLIFYRGGWCPYCNLNLVELQEIEPQLLELGYQIVAITPDRPEKLAPAIVKQNLTYRLFSDSKLDAARAFGLAYKVDEKVVDRYRELNLDIEDASGETHHLLPVPAAYVIDTDGIIVFGYANPNYKVRVPATVLLAAARSAVEVD